MSLNEMESSHSHFPLHYFHNLDYSNPFPGFPHKPDQQYTLTVTQQAITMKLRDHDIALHGDLDSQGNDKTPANPFTEAWGCKAGTVTQEGLLVLANRNLVKVNATSTCSHSHNTLYQSQNGGARKNAQGKSVYRTGGIPDYYPTHNFHHDQTLTYNLQKVQDAAGYSRDKFLYEILKEGICCIVTNKKNGNLKLNYPERMCTIYAFWKAFGMTDEKYRQLYKTLSPSITDVEQLDAQYQEAVSLYKQHEYEKAYELYTMLRDKYDKLVATSTDSYYRLFMTRNMNCTYRKVYSALNAKLLTHDEYVSLLDDTRKKTEKYWTVWNYLAEYYMNAADMLSEINELKLAYDCYLQAIVEADRMGKQDEKLLQVKLESIFNGILVETALIKNGELKKDQIQLQKYLSDDYYYQMLIQMHPEILK